MNWFDGFTPEEIKMLIPVGRGGRQREHWASLSREEREKKKENSFHSKEAKEKSAEASRQRWADMTPEEIRKHVDSSFHTPEAFKKSGETRSRDWANMSDARRKELSLKVQRGLWAFWDSPEGDIAREVLSEAGQRAWASKTKEEKHRWLGVSSHSEEARLKARASMGPPTMPEFFFGICLEKNFPGEWPYNGDGSQGVIIGGKIPDFVRADGKKVVLEVFGGYWHQPGDEEEKIEHYKKYGYDCLVFWDYECCDEDLIVMKVKELVGVIESEPIKGKKSIGTQRDSAEGGG